MPADSSRAPRRGRFITVEGGEGAGKSTQVDLLAAALAGAGYSVATTREPGGSPNAEAIRSLLLEGSRNRWDPAGEVLLFQAARRDHVNQLIEPALASGRWVVCDRFTDSTMAYQGYGHGLPLADLAALQRFAIGDFAPDLTLLLDLPVAEGLARAQQRAGAADRFERLDPAFHARVRQGFLSIAAAASHRFAIINAAAGDRDVVHRQIRAAVETRLGIALR